LSNAEERRSGVFTCSDGRRRREKAFSYLRLRRGRCTFSMEGPRKREGKRKEGLRIPKENATCTI